MFRKYHLVLCRFVVKFLRELTWPKPWRYSNVSFKKTPHVNFPAHKKSHTLQILSEPSRVMNQSLIISLTHLLNHPFAKSPNDSLNQSCHHYVTHSSKHLLIISTLSSNRIINHSLSEPKYQTKISRTSPHVITQSYDNLIGQLTNKWFTLSLNNEIACTSIFILHFQIEQQHKVTATQLQPEIHLSTKGVLEC